MNQKNASQKRNFEKKPFKQRGPGRKENSHSLPIEHNFRPDFMVTAARQTETLLREELKELGLHTMEVPGGVLCHGSIDDALRVCLWSRIGMRVLWAIGQDYLQTEKQLYASVRNLPLADWFDPEHTLAVFAKVSATRGNDTGVLSKANLVALKAKDAIVDDCRSRFHKRPNVNKARPDVSMAIHIHNQHATYWIEMQGAPLSQRGYRIAEGIAPLKQTLAAAMLRYARWDGKRPLMDPTCGSGTIPIEAAMIATNTAPGLFRKFGFMRWPRWDELKPRWQKLIDEANEKRSKLRTVIVGADIHLPTIRKCRQNASQIGFLPAIEWRVADANKIKRVPENTLFVMNPPYGERIGDKATLQRLYTSIWQQIMKYSKASICMITTDEYANAFDTPAARGLNVLNGRLRCRIGLFEKSKIK